jgi:hypothetical protein
MRCLRGDRWWMRLSLSFSMDDLFAMIRAHYNMRVDRPDFQRLTFVLLGVATPSDLIQDKSRTPFNIGRARCFADTARVALGGFRLEEAQPLEAGLAERSDDPRAVLQAVLDWTGGQPFLTQKVCNLLRMGDGIAAGREVERVDEWVRPLRYLRSSAHLLQSWEAQDEPEHLRTIRDRLLRDQRRAGRLLGLYQQILERGRLGRMGVRISWS